MEIATQGTISVTFEEYTWRSKRGRPSHHSQINS